MIELRTLGALELTSADSAAVGSVLAQPRRAALLCYLALASRRGFHRRDTLFSLFWPEYNAEQARHALRQSVYVLRRALGAKTIVSRGDEELALAPEQIRCDVWEFEAAIDQGRPAAAVALYRGELLVGFHISDAPDFERWLDQERSRLRERAGEAGWALAAERERDGDTAGAIEAARRADGVHVYPPVEHPPLSTWVGVGGSPESVVRAARYGFPLTLAIIGGDPRRFKPYVELYHRALAQLGHDSCQSASTRPGTSLRPMLRRARSCGRRIR
ncbi:MAG TPA: hypothetical protein VGJ36_04320 [Gemmatimonadales bacterium]